jgi:hypothetical protein
VTAWSSTDAACDELIEDAVAIGAGAEATVSAAARL